MPESIPAASGWRRHHCYLMGTVAELLVPDDTAPALLEHAVALAEGWEARWTRFQPDSELMTLNRVGHAELHPDTAALLRLALDAHTATGGLFDPTVHEALRAHGYDRSFALLAPPADTTETVLPTGAGTGADAGRTVPGLAASLTLDGEHASLAPGVTLDLGGIAKGHAADRLAALLVAEGVPGALVSLGGDVACVSNPGMPPFPVTVATPDETGVLATVSLHAGAVVTSTTAKRRWTHHGRTAHHLIDPRTGAPALISDAAVLQCSVVGSSAAWAEAFAKAALLAGPTAGLELLAAHGLAGLTVTGDGQAWISATWPALATLTGLSDALHATSH